MTLTPSFPRAAARPRSERRQPLLDTPAWSNSSWDLHQGLDVVELGSVPVPQFWPALASASA